MENTAAKQDILSGNTSLGIELGSTRIKAVLIGSDCLPLAAGSHEWENQLVDGIWTYDLDDVRAGLQNCYANLAQDVLSQYGVKLETVGSLGISAMMHGYLVFDKHDNLLVPFRTWRNTITAESSEKLTALFNYPIPHRWSISHLYQAILNGEAHVSEIAYITTLAGYVHWKLTGEKLVGVGDASGMFPIDLATKQFNTNMIADFNRLIADRSFAWKLETILPAVALAGESSGVLTDAGARLLDTSGTLKPGIPLCPPEGDAGTGMVATNSVAKRTGNVSAGTSIFLMAVLERELSRVHPELDLVTTPAGDLVAMVHCNNCTGDLDAWIRIFDEFLDTVGVKLEKSALYETLLNKALEADPDCGGLLSCNYLSGESITEMDEGRPLFVRTPDSSFTLANFMRSQLYSALATLKIGLDTLLVDENVKLDKMNAHGGFFKVKGVGQRIMAAAINTPVTVNESAAEGGAWGMALLAAFMKTKAEGESLESFLSDKIFNGAKETTLDPNESDVAGFGEYMARYKDGLGIERTAIESLRLRK